MLKIDIPGKHALEISCLVLDFNGTMACDGRLIDGVRERLGKLSMHLSVYVLTADTFGSVAEELQGMDCQTVVIPKDNQDAAKEDLVRGLGAQHCVCVGNGRNDAFMLTEAALGIAVIQKEGCAGQALAAADIATPSILDALDLMIHPLRLTATLRS